MGGNQRSENLSRKADGKRLPSAFCCFAFALLILSGCSDFLHPVDTVPAPTEYEFNYWLLQKTYLFEDELDLLDPDGDSVQTLYSTLSDPFTRYVQPSKSESASISLNTSIVQGDVGMEYYLNNSDHPLSIYRVYPKSPAGEAGVPRYGIIIEANGVDLVGASAFNVYDSILNYSKKIELTVAYQEDTTRYELTKEDVYAPTVFLDTLYETEFISITEFKQTTADKSLGTYGELKELLQDLSSRKEPRVIDLRGNPGGHVSQCISMADLFVKSGNLSTRSWRSLESDGSSVKKTATVTATPGDPGEDFPIVLLVNKNSASCAEIFTAAVAEAANAPVVGTATYGKGIGQSTWKTPAGGLSIITNLEFLTPNGNSYHKKGIQPDISCDSIPGAKCAVEALQKKVGKKSISRSIGGDIEVKVLTRRKETEGGAILPQL